LKRANASCITPHGSRTELEFLNNMGARNRKGYRTGPPGYIGWRNSFLGIKSWAPYAFKNTGSVFLERDDLGSSLLLCPGKMLRQGIYSFLVMAYSALYDNVIEALNLFLISFYTYVAEIQLPGNRSSPKHRVLARVLPCLAIRDSITFKVQLGVDSSLQLSISAETLLMASHLKLLTRV
jgi:hypothetical protein